MPNRRNLNPALVESLYVEALTLDDEVRSAFGQPGDADYASPDNEALVAQSCKGIRSTVRMLHGLNWILRHRAWLRGETSEALAVSQTRLAPAYASVNDGHLRLLPADLQDLATATGHFYERIMRLDDRLHGGTASPLLHTALYAHWPREAA